LAGCISLAGLPLFAKAESVLLDHVVAVSLMEDS
jgi:hypothetical protein